MNLIYMDLASFVILEEYGPNVLLIYLAYYIWEEKLKPQKIHND